MLTKIIAAILPLLFFAFSFSYSQQDYQKWLRKQQRQLQEFKDARDKAFVEFLQREWRAMQLFQGLVPDETPKPTEVPKTALKEIPAVPSTIIKDIHLPEAPLRKSAEAIDWLKSKPTVKEEQVSFSFFNRELQLNIDKTIINIEVDNPINSQQISNFWSAMSLTDYENLLRQAEQLREKMNLNDWGFCLFWNELGRNIYSDQKNKRHLFVWYLLTKGNYEAKVGYNEKQVYLLLPTQQVIYGAPYFDMNQKRYYLISFERGMIDAKEVYTYEGSYPKAEVLVSMNIKNSPLINQIIETKELRFNYFGKEHEIHLQLKKDAIDFFQHYPQTEYPIYFNASLSPEANYSLLSQLKPIIEGKTEIEAVNILLRFVQLAFAYKTDASQFNQEKPFFAEETLFYPFSDCEDRAVLFAHLVHNLVNLKVIGLDYPGHLATAVKFNSELKGDFVEYQGEKYIVCDPTFINANVGQSMPRFKAITPAVISIDFRQ